MDDGNNRSALRLAERCRDHLTQHCRPVQVDHQTARRFRTHSEHSGAQACRASSVGQLHLLGHVDVHLHDGRHLARRQECAAHVLVRDRRPVHAGQSGDFDYDKSNYEKQDIGHRGIATDE